MTIFVITFGWVCCCFAVAPTQKWWQNGQEMFNWSEVHSEKKYYLQNLISAQFFCSDLVYPKLAWVYQKNEWASRKILSSKIGPNFSNKRLKKLKLEIISFNKKWSLKLIFFNEKKWKKSVGFWHRKLTLKVQFLHFSRLQGCRITSIYKIHITLSLKPINFFW